MSFVILFPRLGVCEICDDVPELSDSDEEQWQPMEEASENTTLQCLFCDR